MAIIVDIDVLLARRKMSVAEFAEEVGITPRTSPCSRTGALRPCASPPSTQCAGCSNVSPATCLDGCLRMSRNR
jgi:hypothetical protein